MKIYLQLETLKKVYKIIIIIFILMFHSSVVLGETLEHCQEDYFFLDSFTDDISVGNLDISNNSFFSKYFSGHIKILNEVKKTSYYPFGSDDKKRYYIPSCEQEIVFEANFSVAGWKAFANIKGKFDFTKKLSSHGSRNSIEIREVYFKKSIADFIDLKVGKQIVAWGRSDIFRVTNILNPLEGSSWGRHSIEDIRVPLFMTKVSLFLTKWNFDLITIHENYSPNFNMQSFTLGTTSLCTINESKVAAALTGTFNGWDISLYGANIPYNKDTFFSVNLSEIKYNDKTFMIGSSSNFVKGNILYTFEVAHLRRSKFTSDYLNKHSESDLLLGIEYSGFPNINVGFNYLNRKFHNFNTIPNNSSLDPEKNVTTLACKLEYNCLDDTLRTNIILMSENNQKQKIAMQKVFVNYDIADNWSLNIGVSFFQKEDKLSNTSASGEKISYELRYDF